jgi:hypothetical protein
VTKPLVGIAAGLVSAILTLIVAYVVGVVAIAVNTREFLATVLASVTVWPLMLLFVLLLPTIVVGMLAGVTIAFAAKATARLYLAGAIAGVLFGMALLSGVVPVVFRPANGDFTAIISRPVLSAAYGLVLGLIAARIVKLNVTPRY